MDYFFLFFNGNGFIFLDDSLAHALEDAVMGVKPCLRLFGALLRAGNGSRILSGEAHNDDVQPVVIPHHAAPLRVETDCLIHTQKC